MDAILDAPQIRAVTFVGSTATAKYIYARASANGKRVQAQGGAKNPVVVLPDADMEMTTKIVADSAFGCAGQRCLAVSLAVTVAEARDPFTERICDAAASRVVGYGLDPGVEMGPVISAASKARIEELIGAGAQEGASLAVDGRGASVKGYEGGSFVRPTILSEVRPGTNLARTEVFGPVLGLIHVQSVDEAIELVNSAQYGNQASLFTSSGAAARKFRNEAQAGNIGINIGVAAPDGILPIQRLEGFVLWRPARPGHGCGGVLHAEESGCGALAPKLEPEVLDVPERTTTVELPRVRQTWEWRRVRMPGEYAVELRDVVKRFITPEGRDLDAVANVSMQIRNGEFFSMLGPSGCGKTTSLRLIAGFEWPTSGEVFIEGEAQGHRPPFKRPVNTVFQSYALFQHMNVFQNVAFGLEMEGATTDEIRDARQSLAGDGAV